MYVICTLHLKLDELSNNINTELNDLRKIICLRKSEGSVKRFSVCDVIENLSERGMRCLPCSYTNDLIYITLITMTSYTDVKVTSPR